MKDLLRIFYDILLKVKLSNNKKVIINKNVIKNYLEPESDQQNELTDLLANYFEDFYDFCFELDNNSMLKGQINFKY